MDTLTKVIELIFTPAAIVAGVVLVLRKYLDLHFAKELEEFKRNLESQSERSKIEFQTQLQAQLFEYQTKFSLFHQKQADIVAELYGYLTDVRSEISQLTYPFQYEDGVPLKEKKKKAGDLFNNLSTFHSRHRIYFSEDLDKKIDSTIKLMLQALNEFSTAHNFGMQGSEGYQPDPTGAWDKAWDKVSKELPPLMSEVEKYFRSLLEGKYDYREPLTVRGEDGTGSGV